MSATATVVERAFFGQDAEGCGIPLDNLGTAIQVWTALHTEATGASATLRATAQAFHIDDALVREVVADHPWLYLAGPDDDPSRQTVEHEGA